MRTTIYLPLELDDCTQCPKSKRIEINTWIKTDWKCTVTGNILVNDAWSVKDFESINVSDDSPYRRGYDI